MAACSYDKGELLRTGAVATWPRSCKDLAASGSRDGEYTLYLDGSDSQPFRAYCHDMATEPKTYLPVDENFNFSFTRRPPSTELTTRYSRIRFDPEQKTVDVADRTFASPQDTRLPYGTAVCYEASEGLCAIARADLRGLPFTLDAKDWKTAENPHAGAEVSFESHNGNKTVIATINRPLGYRWGGPIEDDPGNLKETSAWPHLRLSYDSLPPSCEAIRDRQAQPTDGEYTLYLGGNPEQPFKAYCYKMSNCYNKSACYDITDAAPDQMSNLPKTYLTLRQTGRDDNVARYGETVTTQYSRIHVNTSYDPTGKFVLVDIADGTFAETTGSDMAKGSIPYGTAACSDNDQTCPTANINLKGLPFKVVSSWQIPEKVTTKDDDGRVLQIEGAIVATPDETGAGPSDGPRRWEISGSNDPCILPSAEYEVCPTHDPTRDVLPEQWNIKLEYAP
jgi:hypothetical protein